MAPVRREAGALGERRGRAVIARTFGPTNRIVPLIGQGTWDIPESGAALTEAKRALRRGIELGMAHIDTAEMYGNGRVEEIVADAVEGIPREQLFLTTKVLPGNATFPGVLAACERSLHRLRTDYVDLYLLHWPSDHPLSETMRALEQLVADGKARAIGVSNFDLSELREAQTYLTRERLACDQVLYHMQERGIERELVPYCQQHNIAVVAYTPFGRGGFPSVGSTQGKTLDAIAANYGKTPRQVILNFLTREPNVFTIPKASGVAHVEQNAASVGWRLSAEDVAALDTTFPVQYDGSLATL